MDHPVDLAVVFTEVTGTGSESEAEDAAIAAVVTALAGTVPRHQGTVIKKIGAELMIRFPSADTAVTAALEMRDLVRKTDNSFAFKAGIHFGPVTLLDGDLLGDSVSIAARLSGRAMRDQILASGQSVERLSAELKAAARKVEGIETKRFRIDIHEFPPR